MILINDGYGIGTINPEAIYTMIKTRCIELCKIIDYANSSEGRREWALKEFVGYQEELQGLKELCDFPFDVLIIIERDENELK